MDKKIMLVIIALLCVLSSYLFYSYMRVKAENVNLLLTSGLETENVTESHDALNTGESNGTKPGDEFVTFYICGEVLSPDVYTLPKGSRIMDAIDAAGGTTESGSLEMMESAAKEITDGQKIYVPNINDDIDKIMYMNNNNNSAGTRGTKNPGAVVNINTAGIEELCQIPGIGEATAKLIIDFREKNGGFAIIEDIKNVSGIGEKTFESIKDNITVEE